MSLKIVLALIAIAGILGIAIGYILRWLVLLGKKGSMELQIKQMTLQAKEEAGKIVNEAVKKAETRMEELREEIRLAQNKGDEVALSEVMVKFNTLAGRLQNLK